MPQTILVIDGENFLHKIEEVLKARRLNKNNFDLARIGFTNLLEGSFQRLKIDKKAFYAARLHYYSGTKRQSERLIKFQRKLRNNLVHQGFEFIIAGNVRAQKVGNKVVFREKGVDVRIAVDLVSLASDKKIKAVILCSSDSDLQPAVYELKRRGVKVIYLGFEVSPNKGLTYTTDKTVLFKNSDILKALPKKK